MAEGDHFIDRIDPVLQTDGSHIGTMEIRVQSGSTVNEELARLSAENLTLRNRITELERALEAYL